MVYDCLSAPRTRLRLALTVPVPRSAREFFFWVRFIQFPDSCRPDVWFQARFPSNQRHRGRMPACTLAWIGRLEMDLLAVIRGNLDHVTKTAQYSQTKLTTLSVLITVFNASVYCNKSEGLRSFSHVIRVNS